MSDKSSFRMKRVAELIQRELALILQRELLVNSTNIVSISGVDVSKDLRNAKIFISLLDESSENVQKTIELLNINSTALRTLLAKRVTFRNIPRLLFVYDPTQADGMRVTQLINKALSCQ